MDLSYRRYKKYRANQHQYKVEQIAAPIAMMLIIGFIMKFWLVIVILSVVLVVLKSKPQLVRVIKTRKQQYTNVIKKRFRKNDNNIIQKEKKIMSKKGNSTEIGYINKNNQRNNGKTNIPGTGNNQWFYDMECLYCGHKYYANGHDIWLRKCPKCQGGRP